jgi:hypothetical protein
MNTTKVTNLKVSENKMIKRSVQIPERFKVQNNAFSMCFSAANSRCFITIIFYQLLQSFFIVCRKKDMYGIYFKIGCKGKKFFSLYFCAPMAAFENKRELFGELSRAQFFEIATKG